MGKRQNNLFWLSYSDLMTSLFFVMLVLFVLVFSIMQHKANKLGETVTELGETKDSLLVALKEYDRIEKIKKSLENIDNNYFSYNQKYKKHILNIEVRFDRNSADMLDMDITTREKIRNAGKSLENLMKTLPQEDNIRYLLVIEGQASKDNAAINDELSYNRAIALRDFWFGEKPDLNNVLPNCEVVIAGSGQYGVPREKPDIPPANQRFLITIIPKIGEIEMKNRFKTAYYFQPSEMRYWITERKSVDSIENKYDKSTIDSFYSWEKYVGGRFNGYLDKIKAGSYSDDTQLLLSVARSIKPDGSLDNYYFSKLSCPLGYFMLVVLGVQLRMLQGKLNANCSMEL